MFPAGGFALLEAQQFIDWDLEYLGEGDEGCGWREFCFSDMRAFLHTVQESYLDLPVPPEVVAGGP